MPKGSISRVSFALVLLLSSRAAAEDKQDFSDFSLEQLLNLHVTSVSRREEQLLRTASAVYVVTQEDIRRSGATDIADVLRMVPGLNVAQISSSKWAVGSRGFNAQWGNKLLVMVDGRTVYAPTFSGVLWNMQDFILEDIDRIEIIRGPGATVWGANAVNGVISITTKRAADTQGGLVTMNAGSRRPGEGGVRYGGTIGKDAYYRVYANQTHRTSLPSTHEPPVNDAWNLTHGGFRMDWKTSKQGELTVDGDLMRGISGTRDLAVESLAPFSLRGDEHSGQTGGSIRTRWNHAGARSNLTFQAYYESINNYELFPTLEHLFDFDMVHSREWGERHNVTWGMGYRRSIDRNINGAHVGYFPARKSANLSSAFVQDEIALRPDRLYFSLGTKFEHNSYTGFEVQPSARLLWMPSSKSSLWGAVSRALRTPNRGDRSLRIDLDAFPVDEETTGVLTLRGNAETRSETLMAYEAGYRYQPNQRLSIDFASFYNVYDHLGTIEPGSPLAQADSPGILYFPLSFSNLMRGNVYGTEISVSYQVTPKWTLKGSHSLLRMRLRRYADSQDGLAEDAERNSPGTQAYIGSTFRISRGMQVSSNTYFVASLPAWNIPAYVRQDVSLIVPVGKSLELRVVGQNLLNTSQAEFGEAEGTAASVMKRGVFLRLGWKF